MSEKHSIRISFSKLDLRFRSLRRVPESSVQHIAGSLKRHGQLTPVVVAQEEGAYVLIDGFKRGRASEMLGLGDLEAVVISCSGASMKAQMYLLNRQHGFTLIEEGLLVRELVDKDGLLQVEAAVMLERHKSWVSRRLEMIRRLAPQIVEDIQVGLIPPGSARALARLPACNQADFSSVIQQHRLQAGESRQLIDLWCKIKDPETRAFLMSSPREALELAGRDDGAAFDPRIPLSASRWLKTVRMLERVAAVLRRHSSQGLEPLTDIAVGLLSAHLVRAEAECRDAFDIAERALRKEKCNEQIG